MQGLKKTFLRGLALAVPLAIIAYVFIRIIGIIKKIITPVAAKMGIDNLLGGATLTVITLLIIVILILLLGLLMKIRTVSTFRKGIENTILKYVPSLTYLKVMADDKLDLENSQNKWKPVIVFFEQKYNPAFIVEESETLITLFVTKGTSLKDGEILITSKDEISLFPVTYDELNKFSRAYGKGFIPLIKPGQKS